MNANREEHQPRRKPKRRKTPSTQQLQACAGSVAVVLATDEGTTPLSVMSDDLSKDPVVCGAGKNGSPLGIARPLQEYRGKAVVAHALRCALECRFAAVEVVVGGDRGVKAAIKRVCREERSEAARSLGRGACPALSFVDYDAEGSRKATLDAAGFELHGIAKGVLDYARAALDEHPDADSVVVFGCDQVRIAPAHVLELVNAFRCEPDLDVVSSWIAWLRRTPMLISRAFLESFDDSPLCKPAPQGTGRPLPSINTKDVVFGEEMLQANFTVPARREAFLGGVTLSAREAVRAAHAKRAGGEALKGASPADAELLDAAEGVVARLDAWRDGLSAARARKLAWADGWAQRNRLDFPLLNDPKHKGTLAYLDSAATTQRCSRALDEEARFSEHENANVYRGGYELSMQATFSLNDARKALEDFIGADRRQTVLTMNASAGCNLIAQAWGERNIGAGDLIVVALSEHHSNMLPWTLLADRKDAEVAFVPVKPDGRLDLDVYKTLLKRKPKLVCVAQVSNVLGLVNPVRDMARAAHKVGARFMLDAAQSFPHLPFKVKELGCDFAAFSAHKMYGPTGIGGLWIAPEAFDEMDPVTIGGGTISHASTGSYYLRAGAIQYEVGTPPIAQAVGWAGAVSYMSELGMDAVLDHAKALTAFTCEALGAIEGLTIWGDHSGADGAGGLVSFSVAGEGANPAALGAFCGKLGVAIRSGGHCALPITASMGLIGTGRASFGVHTTCEDIEALAVAVEMFTRTRS